MFTYFFNFNHWFCMNRRFLHVDKEKYLATREKYLVIFF